jgi:hypothetical protein
MDAPSVIAVILLLIIFGAIIAIPVWIFRRIRRWRDSKKRTRAYPEQIANAKSALLAREDEASLPTLDAAGLGYRPVGNEKVLAVQIGAKRMEMKSTGRYGTAGTSISIPIIKGVRYRIGGGSIRTEKSWQVTGNGRLIVTDKALSFESQDKNERITWSQIADVRIFTDGFQIAKRSGPPRTYVVESPDPNFAAVLELMLAKVE